MKTKTMLRLVASALVIALAMLLWNAVVEKPFPFLDVAYVTDASVFDAPCMGHAPESAYALRIPALSEERALAIRQFVGLHETAGPAQTATRIRALVQATRTIMAGSAGNDLRSPQDILDTDPRFKNICSEFAKVLCVLAQAHGNAARVVWMHGHTTSEIFFAGHGWIHVDAMGNIAFTGADNRFLSLLEYRRNPAAATVVPLDQTRHQPPLPSFAPDFANYQNIYTENELYLVLSGASIFDYPQNHRNLLRILKSVLNMADLGHGTQFIGERGQLPKVGNIGLDAVRYLP